MEEFITTSWYVLSTQALSTASKALKSLGILLMSTSGATRSWESTWLSTALSPVATEDGLIVLIISSTCPSVPPLVDGRREATLVRLDFWPILDCLREFKPPLAEALLEFHPLAVDCRRDSCIAQALTPIQLVTFINVTISFLTLKRAKGFNVQPYTQFIRASPSVIIKF